MRPGSQHHDEIVDNPNLVHVRGDGWIRLHRSLLSHHKIGALSDEQFRLYVLLLLMADSEHGKLPARPEIAWHARQSSDRVNRIIDELIDHALVDISSLGNLFMHGWKKHQYKWDGTPSTKRVQKSRAKKKQPCNSDETALKQRGNKIASESHSDSSSPTTYGSDLGDDSSSSQEVGNLSKGNDTPARSARVKGGEA